MSRKILITGGAGFIGSVISSFLLDNGFEVAVVDDLSTGNLDAIDPRVIFYQGSILDKSFLLKSLIGFDLVIHCAAKALVEESVSKPGLYEQTNFQGTKVLLDAMQELGIGKIIFSSTAAVYGDSKIQPIPEHSPLSAVNPYGESKIKCEKEISKRVTAGMSAVTFRYFNVSGSYKNSLGKLVFENHANESHLIPIILKKFLENGSETIINIYGDKWQTPDGSCVRDYCHVVDIARAHMLAVNKLVQGEHKIFNLGSGIGYSVFDVLDQISKIVQVKLHKNICSPRAGDPAVLLADTSKARDDLNWSPKFTLEDIVASSWQGISNS